MLGECLLHVRKKRPLIHNITNYVTANDVANMLLACGASPIMSDEPMDVEEVTARCAGLNINLGTLNARRIESMFRAGKRANELGHALLLDPVGVGASSFRKKTVRDLLGALKFDLIRGNMSEIRVIVQEYAKPSRTDIENFFLDHDRENISRGVDADIQDVVTQENLEDAVHFAKSAARWLETMVAVSGKIDLISDGKRCFIVYNGQPEMRQVTGAGCQLSGMMTAFLAANPETKLEASAAAACTMGLAGEIGWRYLAPYEGNGTYRNRMIDAVFRMDSETLEREARYEVR